jgi:hypothetical protein
MGRGHLYVGLLEQPFHPGRFDIPMGTDADAQNAPGIIEKVFRKYT